jgi:hypothetical protein
MSAHMQKTVRIHPLGPTSCYTATPSSIIQGMQAIPTLPAHDMAAPTFTPCLLSVLPLAPAAWLLLLPVGHTRRAAELRCVRGAPKDSPHVQLGLHSACLHPRSSTGPQVWLVDCAHTRNTCTCTRTYARTRTHAHAHERTYVRTHANTCTRTRPHAYSYVQSARDLSGMQHWLT